MIERIWYSNLGKHKSLTDVYIKYAFLDLRNDATTRLIDNECLHFLSTRLIFFEEEVGYFIYELKFDKTGEKITILPDNILCALWFIGEFPLDTKKVLDTNYFENKKNIYTFDEKKSKLKVKPK